MFDSSVPAGGNGNHQWKSYERHPINWRNKSSSGTKHIIFGHSNIWSELTHLLYKVGRRVDVYLSGCNAQLSNPVCTICQQWSSWCPAPWAKPRCPAAQPPQAGSRKIFPELIHLKAMRSAVELEGVQTNNLVSSLSRKVWRMASTKVTALPVPTPWLLAPPPPSLTWLSDVLCNLSFRNLLQL